MKTYDQIVQLIQEQNMTETAIARKANIDRNTLRNYRKHEQSPTLRALEKIGKVVGFKLTVEKCKKPRG